jgi:hypothetical protein
VRKIFKKENKKVVQLVSRAVCRRHDPFDLARICARRDVGAVDEGATAEVEVGAAILKRHLVGDLA